ncbi:MAG: YbaB/EbfC family nucleoid-associated protein [Patescibacteria group bacterium]|uniref:YbaB/EbfC family nucleoid-associated protein n=1 Tax=candidate division WWE3 bacterium TaxID=2053526 RepID=A0A955J3S9_UNCKA|nr:YbaB/EbfC family nucleoid-associated protein [candidate division WWE3 bacterium]
MLDKIKSVNKLRKMQADIQKQLEQILHSETKGTSEVVVKGDKKIDVLIIDGEERKDIKDLINAAFKNVEKKAEKKMRSQAGSMMEMFGI